MKEVKFKSPFKHIISKRRSIDNDNVRFFFFNKTLLLQCKCEVKKKKKERKENASCNLAGTVSTAFHTVDNFFLEFLPFLLFGHSFFLCMPFGVILAEHMTALCMPHF